MIVTVRDFVRADSNAPVATMLGVHFDTKGNRNPNHLIKIDGMHVAAGSTWNWNRLRPNGIDPWGDWWTCVPGGWDKPFIRALPRANKVVFLAPRSCLGDRGWVRVAVQSYKPYGTRFRDDWAKGKRAYLPRIRLN